MLFQLTITLELVYNRFIRITFAVKEASKRQESGYVWDTTGERVIIVMGALNVILSRVSRTLTKYYSYIA